MKLSTNTMRQRCYLPFLLVVMAHLIPGISGNATMARAAERPLMTAVQTDTAPVIDGVLTDDVWQKAPEVGHFVQNTPTNSVARQQASVRCLYDAQNLYVAISSVQPRGSIKATAGPDGDVWNDDSVEVFIKPHILTRQILSLKEDEQHFHFMVNSAGTKFDEIGAGGATSWNGNWEVKTVVRDTGWNAELKIPFSTLYDGGQAPAPYTSWGIQFGRTVSSTGEYSALFPVVGAFRNHAAFGYLVFVNASADESPVRWNLDNQQIITPRLENIHRQLTLLKPPANSDFELAIKRQAKSAAALRTEFDAISPSAYTASESGLFQTRLETLEKAIRGSQEQMVAQKAKQLGNTIAIAPHPAVKDLDLVKPDFLPALEAIGQSLKTTVTAGEYQAASFVFWTAAAQSNVTVKVGPLAATAKVQGRTAATLAPSAVDVKWVKCWYQAGTGEVYRGAKVLTPELLLKNPDLVTVDYQKQENILLDFKRPGYYSVPGYPGDATTLQPLKAVAPRTATQVWLTINVPKGTAPGRYRGTIQVQSNGKPLASLPLDISVLDFELAPSMMEHNWYTESGWGQIDVPWQNPQRALAEVQDLARHGVTNVGLSENLKDLPRAVALMKQGGLRTDKLYMLAWGNATNHLLDWSPEKVREEAAGWVAGAKALGINDISLYLVDEARGEVLASARPAADAIHAAGAKIWVARSDDFSPVPGDFIDEPVHAAGMAGADVVDKIHAAGHKIFSYANPQSGMERPELYRRRFGLLLWQANYDGAFCWHYYATFGASVMDRNPWDDFQDPLFRQCVMAYPTRTGVVDTIQWEGWREGVNDCRYMATLLREIHKAKTEARAGAAVAAAEAWLTTLKAGGETALNDLDSVRAETIAHIQACRQGK